MAAISVDSLVSVGSIALRRGALVAILSLPFVLALISAMELVSYLV